MGLPLRCRGTEAPNGSKIQRQWWFRKYFLKLGLRYLQNATQVQPFFSSGQNTIEAYHGNRRRGRGEKVLTCVVPRWLLYTDPTVKWRFTVVICWKCSLICCFIHSINVYWASVIFQILCKALRIQIPRKT